MLENDEDDVVKLSSESRLEEKSTRLELDIDHSSYAVFDKYLQIKYDGDYHMISEKRIPELKHIITTAFTESYNMIKSSSSSSLFLNGRKIRSDEAEKISKIMNWLLMQSTYPKFHTKQIILCAKMVLGTREPRTIKKYYQTVIKNSIRDIYHGLYDVSPLYDQIPKSLLFDNDEKNPKGCDA